MVRPFLGFGHMPDQKNFFNACAIGMDLGIRIKPGQLWPATNSLKCRGIVRTSCVYQNPAQRCCNRENVRIRHTFRDDALRQFEINFRFAAKNTGDDLGSASSRVRFSFLDRLSGSGGCLAANSSDNRS